MAYFTQAELEAYIQSSITVEDYQKAERLAKQFIEQYTGQMFEQEDYMERHRVDDVIALRRYPVKEIYSVKAWPEDIILSPGLYVHYDWGVEILESIGYTLIDVHYRAGWDAIPEPIKQAALWLSKRILVPLDKPTPTVSSISTGGTSETFLTADPDNGRPTDDDWVNSILNQYRRTKVL